jgi:hypothetical protein
MLMVRKILLQSIEKGFIEWSTHSLRNMFERGITRNAVLYILGHGEIIEEYNEDKPFPSALLLGFWKEKPIHAVIAYDEKNEEVFVITAYEPDNEHFESDWKTRRKK